MHRFGRALGAVVTTALVTVGLSTAVAGPAEAEPASQQGILPCVPLPGLPCLPDLPGLPGLPLPGLPSPDQPPALTGIPVVGEVLTLTEPVWNLLPGELLSTDVTWLCERDGDTIPIPGTEGLWSYRPTEAQAGCQMTAQLVTTVANFLPLTMVTNALSIAGVGQTAVTADGAPTIKADKGAAKTGTTLSVSAAPSWKQEGVTTTYQWLRNGQPITGKTGTQYLLTKEDVDQSISARATGTKDNLTGVTTSNTLKGELGDAITPTRQPAITGTPAVGRTLTVDPGAWGTGDTPTYTYQWRRDTTDVAGATGATYAVTTTDVGHTLTVVVTATRAGYRPGTFRTAGATVTAATTKARSALTATLSKKVIKKGRTVKLAMVLTAVGVTAPSGTVSVMDGRRVLKRLSLTAGKATLRLKKLKPGVHKIKAVYAGSDTVLGSTSKIVKLRVKKNKRK